MIYAQIKDGKVKHCLVLDDPTLTSLFLEGYDYLVRVDELEPRPGRDWGYDGSDFSPPDEG